MSSKTDKINKFRKNVLDRHEWDDVEGSKITNDFLQMSKIAEELKTSNPKAYVAFMSLIKDNIELQEANMERGTRISKLQKGQTQPK